MLSSRGFFAVITIAVFLSAAAEDSSVNWSNIFCQLCGTQNECVYTFYVQTGSGIKSGTDSAISVVLGDSQGRSVWVPNLRSWGLMGHSHDYFERGNLDIFTGLGPCVGAPLCRLNLTSDGSGAHHGWYCDFVEVTSTGPHKDCSQSIFYVDQWLATDAPPFELTAVIDGCDERLDGPAKAGAFVAGSKPVGSASEKCGL
ncbi:hypothetical protein RHGRI_008312 [Rhododendron griersonianum]|uniref:PLAT domain-containing protein n=1 Tax=Rhododendron griersonianum TaxID=479676 RepID=A0AAV6KZW6_9ERIC|nr:hypothetical protein RHGRI_008312 [Rhododendron griersonianum]